MIKTLTFEGPYNEARLRSVFEIFNRYPSAKPEAISIRFASQPTMVFEFTFGNLDNLLMQVKMIEEALKDVK